jgi:hypothetical protein
MQADKVRVRHEDNLTSNREDTKRQSFENERPENLGKINAAYLSIGLLFLQAVPTKCADDTLNITIQKYEASPKPTENEAILQNENHLPKQKVSKQDNGANAALPRNAKSQSSDK